MTALLTLHADRILGRSPFELEAIYHELRESPAAQQPPGPPACPGLDIALWDLVGQAQVSYLVGMARNDGDKVNYAMIALHPRKEIVLVDAYRQTLGVEFPVALADAAATSSAGPFGEIPAVPTIIVLDRLGRIAWKHTGLAKNDEIRGHMRDL